MLRRLRQLGLSSDLMYAAGFASILFSIVSWYISKNTENADIDRADRWGIFVGEWAPTFFALGAGLRLEEEFGQERQETQLAPTAPPS